MPRLPRPVCDGLLYHASNRGKNRAAGFAAADFQACLDALRQTQRRYAFRPYGLCLRSQGARPPSKLAARG